MEDLINRIRDRLASGAYGNEAAVSLSILMPLLQKLGWDTSDPDQVIPEYTSARGLSGRGRVDFALCSTNRRPAVFIEVKGVGRSVEGDRQLFEYAFHEGVPLCLLTDGREWSFYLPGGQGSYDDRRLYRLQIDERQSEEAKRVFIRYLSRERIRSGAAVDDAQRDYRDAAAKRDAARALPRAWAELIQDGEELLIELLGDKAEALCGFRPPDDSVLGFLRGLTSAVPTSPSASRELRTQTPAPIASQVGQQAVPSGGMVSKGQEYRIFGETLSAPTAAAAFVDILTRIVARAPDRLPEFARAARGRSRNHIGRTPEEIYPKRPDLARAAEIAPGWLVGLNISNRDKAKIIQAAIDVFGLVRGSDVDVTFPNE